MKAKKGDKVVCVETGGCDSITIGKIYEVMATVDSHFYFITNDIGVSGFSPIEYFMKLNEWRQQQINKVL